MNGLRPAIIFGLAGAITLNRVVFRELTPLYNTTVQQTVHEGRDHQADTLR